MNERAPRSRPESEPGPNPQRIYNRHENPYIKQGSHGVMVAATDEGFAPRKPVNEDGVVIWDNGIAVIDGIGGHGAGDKATQLVAESVEKGVVEGATWEDIQTSAHRRMKESRLGSSGACYLGASLEGQNLEIAQAGDARLVVVREGEAVFSTVDETLPNKLRAAGREVSSQHELATRNVVVNTITGTERGETTISEVRVHNGDLIVAASDHLWDNVETHELVQWSLKHPNELDLMKCISDETARRQQLAEGSYKPDHRSTVLWRITEIKAD